MKYFLSLVIALCFCCYAYADNQEQRYVINVVHLNSTAAKFFKATLLQQNNNSQIKAAVSSLPSAINLGMNKTPILDQGIFFSCVTFATTAALDAALGKGDYISQLCLLELMTYFNQNNYYHSPWEDSTPDIVIHTIQEFGIINKTNQQLSVCGNIKDYPPISSHINPSSLTLSPTDYHKYSENIFHNLMGENQIAFRELYSLPDNFYGDDPKTLANDAYRSINPNEALQVIKTSLAQGNRVVVGMLVDLNPTEMKAQYFARGHYQRPYDTWFLTNAIKEHLNDVMKYKAWGGHEVILYGYDDNAVALDKDGKKEKGLFLVRNSYGKRPPNKGIEFMTYDFLKLLSTDATSIVIYK